MSTYPGWYLQLGSLGEHVRQVQRCLNNIAFVNPDIPLITEDGNFGPKTAEAVKAFQRIYGLKVDGIVGPVSWDQLMKECNTSIPHYDYNFIPFNQNTSNQNISQDVHFNGGFQEQPMSGMTSFETAHSFPGASFSPSSSANENFNTENFNTENFNSAGFNPESFNSVDSSSVSNTPESHNSTHMLKFLLLGTVLRSSNFTNK